MGGGPKASAANLEPLGKRRRFENLADSSSVEACASHVHEVRSVNDMAPVSSGAKDSRSAPLLSTEQTTTSHTESKLNAKWSDTAPAQVDEPGVSHPPNAEAPFSTMRTTMTGSIANIRSVKGTKDPTKRAPSPRTRLETSGALALAQEWQAKFKPLPKKPSMPNSLHEIDTREQSIRMVSEQRKLDWPDPKRLPAKKSKLKDYTSIATGKIDEESRQYRRKSGTGPQASAANLEPLGKLRRVFSPNASADRSPDPSGYQQPSAQVASVDTPALGIQKPKPDVALDAIGLSQSTEHTPEGREVLAPLKQLPSKAQDFGRNAARAFQRPSSPRNDPSLFTRTKKTGNIDVFEDPLRKRKRIPSPYRRREECKKVGRWEDRDHRRDSARNDVLGRGRSSATFLTQWTETYPRGAHPSCASVRRKDRVSDSERDRAPARYQNEGQDIEDYSNRDRRIDSRLRDERRPYRDDSLHEWSHAESHPYRRDRSASPRRSHHDRQSNCDNIRYRGDDRRHRGGTDLHARKDTERRSWADYQGREYRHRDTRHFYEVSRSARYESDPHKQSRSSDQHLRSEHRPDFRGDGIHPMTGRSRDDRYRARDFNRR
ncbi:uncharacterized protein CC84DRAFT_1173757 [Paraphaeosphaeria sporulosa]|uniref:Uncharacterized protein n=1 Tax=Paraphaeosphaeria sporulosa TaxID=1460663 RepID=A0A177CMX4_9PLEO|nr:uncharacterized protein CC84DRAFT_1173757 [Paraphaeosphaeria sporulosa]OAG08238.1 hypothetical protein CC84DRAFT_1173757 [Paraphaeosphaeria sporulosa]